MTILCFINRKENVTSLSQNHKFQYQKVLYHFLEHRKIPYFYMNEDTIFFHLFFCYKHPEYRKPFNKYSTESLLFLYRKTDDRDFSCNYNEGIKMIKTFVLSAKFCLQIFWFRNDLKYCSFLEAHKPDIIYYQVFYNSLKVVLPKAVEHDYLWTWFHLLEHFQKIFYE